MPHVNNKHNNAINSDGYGGVKIATSKLLKSHLPSYLMLLLKMSDLIIPHFQNYHIRSEQLHFSTLEIIFLFFTLQEGTEKSITRNDLVKVLIIPQGGTELSQRN